MLPFKREQFFTVFTDYNASLWPASLAAYGFGAIAVLSILGRWKSSPRIVSAVLALMWAWTGIAYHYAFFTRINTAAPLFAALFVLGAGVIAWQGIVHQRIMPVRWLGWRSGIGWALIAYAAIAYPLIGLMAGHPYSGLPQFGVTPCPVTIFTLGLLLLSRPPFSWLVMAIPVLWSVVGGSAAFLLDVPQDWPLLLSGAASLLVMFLSRRDAAS